MSPLSGFQLSENLKLVLAFSINEGLHFLSGQQLLERMFGTDFGFQIRRICRPSALSESQCHRCRGRFRHHQPPPSKSMATQKDLCSFIIQLNFVVFFKFPHKQLLSTITVLFCMLTDSPKMKRSVVAFNWRLCCTNVTTHRRSAFIVRVKRNVCSGRDHSRLIPEITSMEGPMHTGRDARHDAIKIEARSHYVACCIMGCSLPAVWTVLLLQ